MKTIGHLQRSFLHAVRHHSEDDPYGSWILGVRSRGEHRRVAESLVRKGLIRPHTPTNDRDRQAWELTDEGRAVLARHEGAVR